MIASSLYSQEQELLQARNPQSLHKKALEYFDMAVAEEFKHQNESAAEHYARALKFEEQAALVAQNNGIGEPSVSILFRSAASIAIRANSFYKAVELAKLGLSPSTPSEIEKELEEIIENYKAYIPPHTSDDSMNTRQPEFFCVSTNLQMLSQLIHSFNAGYSAETPEFALIMLQKMDVSPNRTLPDLIVCDWQFGITDINAFCYALDQHPRLSLIPLVLNGAAIPGKDLEIFKRNPYIDDIIFLEGQNVIDFSRKVEFLKKIKGNIKGNEQAYKHQEQFNVGASMNKAAYWSNKMKRVFDIIVSLLLLTLSFPFILLIAICIKIESKGPVFYIAKRAGRGYKIFNFYKFRTMVVNADSKIKELAHLNQYNKYETGVFFKISNDPRITTVGKFLRNTNLDELPQLFNVLRGDMSFVGNRPLPLYEAATLTTDEWAKRFLSPAGITGLWQIKKRGRVDMSVEERLNLDIHYAESSNFLYDMWIIANTPSSLLQRDNV